MMPEPSILWFIAGVLFVALEAFGVSGIGFFFAGLSGLCVALLVKAGMMAEGAVALQFVAFFLLTAAWAALLWKPMRRWRVGSGRGSYSHMLGDEAVVTQPLARGEEGQVRWSGTLMRAGLAPEEAAERLETGAAVVIAGVEGNKVFVKKKG